MLLLGGGGIWEARASAKMEGEETRGYTDHLGLLLSEYAPGDGFLYAVGAAAAQLQKAATPEVVRLMVRHTVSNTLYNLGLRR